MAGKKGQKKRFPDVEMVAFPRRDDEPVTE